MLAVVGYRGGWFLSDNDRIGEALRFALPEGPAITETTLNLDEVVDGEWDRVVITCSGMTFGEVRRALGGTTKEDDVEMQRPTIVLYFLLGDEIEKTYLRDADSRAEPVYFEPCTRNGQHVVDPIVLARDDARLAMERDPVDPDRWVLAGP